MKLNFLKHICYLSLVAIVSAPLAVYAMPVADGVDTFAGSPIEMSIHIDNDKIRSADGIDIFGGSPIETSTYIDENGEVFNTFSRRYGSPSFTTGVFLSDANGRPSIFRMDRNGTARFSQMFQMNISSMSGEADISYQILDTSGRVISGQRRVGNGTVSPVDVTSRHQASMDVNVFIANNARREATVDGFFHW